MKSFFCRMLVAAAFVAPVILCAQGRDVRGGRIVLDDNGDDGTLNTLTLNLPALGQNTILTVPDLGTDSVQFVLFGSGTSNASIWLLGGNAGTTPGTDFIGTADNQSFQIHVDNDNTTGTDGRGRVLRFEPNATSANIIGGYHSNAVNSGAVGATIGGGGKNGGANTVSSDYSTIGGGATNVIGTSSDYATVAGGGTNQITGSAADGTIAGGLGNLIVSGDHTTISGGFNNSIQSSSFGSTISGGTNNRTSSYATVIGGGDQNSIGTSSYSSTIAGGDLDTINSNSQRSTIGGGSTNFIGSGSSQSTIGGGYQNGVDGSATRTTVGGGYRNFVESGAGSSTIAGGQTDSILDGSWQSAIGGGGSNVIDSSSWQSTISGGGGNRIGGSGVNSAGSVIGGGAGNTIVGRICSIPGGRGLTLTGVGSFGFLNNNLGSNDMSISSNGVAVFGNTDLWLANNHNAASQIRFYETYNTSGAFPNGTNYTSLEAQAQSADIEYLLPAAAGTVGQQLTVSAVSGTQVTLGWAAASDRRKKTSFLTLSGEAVLEKFRTLELGTWRYNPAIDPKGTRHYGIMAQDFHAAFGNDGVGVVGTDTTVTDLDLHGVSYLAIQGLEKRTDGNRETNEVQDMRIKDLQSEVEKLRAQNAELSTQLQSLRRIVEKMGEEESR